MKRLRLSLISFLLFLLPPFSATGEENIENFIERNFSEAIPNHIDTQIYNAITSIDSILFSSSGIQEIQKAELLCEKARLYNSGNYYATAISLYDQALELLEKHSGTEQKRIDILLESSKLHEPYGDYSSGVEKLYNLLKIAGGNDTEQTISAYISLGHYYILLNNTQLAKEHLDSAATRLRHSELEEKDRNELQYKLHNTLAGIWASNNLDSAFLHLDLAERYAHRDLHKMQIIYQNRAILHGYLHDYETAEKYFQKSLVLIEDEFQKLCVSSNLAELENLKGNQNKSMAMFRDVILQADRIKSMPLKVQALKNLSDIHAQRHDFEESYRLLHASQTLADSSFLSENRRKIFAIQRDFELFKAENEKRIYDYQNEVTSLQIFKKNTLIVLFSIGLCILFITVLILYRKFRRQHDKSEYLSNLLSNKISEDDQLMKEMQDETDRKSRELATTMLSIAQISDILSDTLKQTEILKHRSKDKKSNEIISSIEGKIRSLNLKKQEWDNFKLYFNQVHPDFFSNLNKVYPNLTAGENRICSFILMNLTTKDIASLLNRSPRTIDTIKFRIRRKMNIPKEVSILSFLQNFTHNDNPAKSDNM